MKTLLRALAIASIIAVSVPVTVRGQNAPPRPPEPPSPQAPRGALQKTGPVIPLRIQVVIARYQGDKKVSSLPYMLLVNANEDGGYRADGTYVRGSVTRLRIGAQVPVATFGIPKDAPPSPLGINYKDIGTSIDCDAHSVDNGRFAVTLSIDDSSVYSEGPAPSGGSKLSDVPSFRSFRVNNTLLLRDGQTTQLIVAGDKVTGEVTKVDVTLNVEK